MQGVTARQTRWLGLAGVAGALLLMVGDQCLYFAPVGGAEFNARVLALSTAAPVARALFGAGLAPIAALLFLGGFTHVYLHVRARQPRLAALIWTGLALCILAGATYHALWGAKILVLHASTTDSIIGSTGLYVQLRNYAAGVYSIAEITGYPAIALLALLIVTGRTDYPRWFCMLLPVVPLLLLQWITPSVPAPLGSLVGGSAANIAFTLFFAFSVALTSARAVGATEMRSEGTG